MLSISPIFVTLRYEKASSSKLLLLDYISIVNGPYVRHIRLCT